MCAGVLSALVFNIDIQYNIFAIIYIGQKDTFWSEPHDIIVSSVNVFRQRLALWLLLSD